MGGDEVDFRCWERSSDLKSFMKNSSLASFMDVWKHFQTKAYERLEKRAHKVPLLWTSPLTADLSFPTHFPPDLYIIQNWMQGEV